MPKARAKKFQTFASLARAAPAGTIVELGTYRGLGAFALWWGSDKYIHRVYTIDDFLKRKGWANEEYVADNLKIARSNLRFLRADVTIRQGDARKMAKKWPDLVSLIVWDLGVMARVVADLYGWRERVLPGGFLAMHDTFDQQLGSRTLEKCLADDGGWIGPQVMPGGVWAWKRKDKV